MTQPPPRDGRPLQGHPASREARAADGTGLLARVATLGPAAFAVAALLAAPLLERWVPLADGDPLRSTLALVPALVAAVLAVEGWMRRQRVAALGAAEAGLLAGLATALLVGALRWQSLGLSIPDSLVFTGFVLVLFYWIARALLRLRPLLGRPLAAGTAPIFFYLPLVLYLFLTPWSTQRRAPDGDEPYNLLLAHSLAFDFDADLANNYRQADSLRFVNRELGPQPRDPEGAQGEQYSRHTIALPLLLAPAYRLGGKFGALATMAVLAAALAWWTLHLARRLFPDDPGGALLAYAVFALTPPFLLYAHQVWVEIPAGLLLVVAFHGLHRVAPRAPLARNRATLAWTLVCILLLPLVKLRFAALSISLLGLLAWRTRHSKRWIWTLVAAAAIGPTAFLVYNQVRFGRLLRADSLDRLNLTGDPLGSLLTGAGGLFFDGAFGLFLSSPLWLLLLPAVLGVVWRHHRIAAHVAVVVVPYLLAVGLTPNWYGGWSPPFRLGIVVLPLLAVLLVPVLAQRRRPGARLALAGLGSVTVILTLVWVLQPGLAYDWPNGTTRLSEALGGRLGVDVSRLLPSTLRVRPATFAWSIGALAAIVAWRLPVRRPVISGSLGVALLLLGATTATYLASSVPTRNVNFEDAFVLKSGGSHYPDLWQPGRGPRLGWSLPEGERLEVPLVAGGEALYLELDILARPPGERPRSRPAVLRVLAGAHELGRTTLDGAPVWRTLRLGPYPWPTGESLTFELEDADNEPRIEVVLDRLRFDWR